MSKICSKCGEKIGFDEYSFDGKCEKCYKEGKNVQNTELMKCKKCSKKISEEEAKSYNGYCENCYKEFEMVQPKIKKHGSNIKNDYDNYNVVARIIKVISIIIVLIGFIYGAIMSEDWETEKLVLPIIIGSIVFSVFIYGYGEIIQLLEDIKNK